ncbi:hypothetical protein KCP74_17915 [Salmonella enterica subsp. enterica]|nr:hypothetical protein KCP74_17915 [Salmonella enterica subsp. enterica]
MSAEGTSPANMRSRTQKVEHLKQTSRISTGSDPKSCNFSKDINQRRFCWKRSFAAATAS